MDNFEKSASEKNEEIVQKTADSDGKTNKTKKNHKKMIVILVSIVLSLIVVGTFAAYVIIPRIGSFGTFIPECDNPDEPGLSLGKPIIYLYPEHETEVTVKLANSQLITCSYPKYMDEWNVNAQPDGSLVDLSTGRRLYALYYESKAISDLKMKETGFVVDGNKTIEFLEEKLEVLGLNEREAEEFIVYWLPKLERNKYNYIRFATSEEIEVNMPLEIVPVPDTTIRILMIYKGLEKSINVEEQNLITPERKGFTIVEWGGTEIK